MSLKEVEQQVAENGLGLSEVLDFFRLLPGSDMLTNRTMFTAWLEDLTAAGASIDQEVVDRVYHDLERHGRLTAETIMGAPHAPYISLNNKPEHHFAN